MNFSLNLEKGLAELSKHGAFISTTGDKGDNTMTASWGYVGFMWQKPYFIALVRPQRHTFANLKQTNCFTISVPFGTALKDELKICGTKSGSDTDKSKVVQFEKAISVKAPVVAGCNLYYECEVDYTQQLDGNALPDSIVKTFYKGDFHYMIFGKILQCYEK